MERRLTLLCSHSTGTCCYDSGCCFLRLQAGGEDHSLPIQPHSWDSSLGVWSSHHAAAGHLPSTRPRGGESWVGMALLLGGRVWGQKPEVLMFSESRALRAPDGKVMGIRIPCRHYDSLFSKTREYSLLCFEDGMIKLVASECSLPSRMCVLMSCLHSQLPDLAAVIGTDAKSSYVRPLLEVCPWVTAATSPRGVRE